MFEEYKEDLYTIIQEILKTNTGVLGKITDTRDLSECGLDSITAIDLIVAVEEKFGIAVEDQDLLFDNLNTVEKLLKLIAKYKNLN